MPSLPSERTDTDIANMAMDLLGEPPIADLEEPRTDLERRAQRRFHEARDFVLSQNWWKASRAEERLTLLSGVVDEEFPAQVQLPENCVLVWTVNGDQDGFEQIAGPGGGRLAGRWSGAPRVVYGRRLSAAETPLYLQRLIAAQLALDLAPSLGVEVKGDRLRRLEAAHEDAMAIALATAGAVGGREQPIRSRYVDAMDGYAPERGGP